MIRRRYTGVAIALHWVIAVAIVANVALAWIWPGAATAQAARSMIEVHKSIGVSVLGLAVLRILWRIGHKPPPLPGKYRPWEVRASHFTHWGLYALIFIMPLTGWIMDSAWKGAPANPMYWFGLFEWPRIGFFQTLAPATRDAFHDGFGEAHEIAAKFVYLLVALHLLGALKHQFWDRTREFQRIWFWGRPE